MPDYNKYQKKRDKGNWRAKQAPKAYETFEMPKPTPGRGGFTTKSQGGARANFDNKLDSIKSYNDKALSELGKYFFTFSGEKVAPNMSAYSDTDYLILHYIYPDLDTETGFDALLDAVIDEGHVSGHMKEVVAGEKSAYKDYCAPLFKALLQISLWKNIYYILDAPTESDDWSFSAETGPGINTLEAMNQLEGQLVNRRFIIPDWIKTLVKLFTLRIKLHDGYVKRKKHIPARFYIPFTPNKDKADIQTLLNSAYTQKGQAKLHMDKFGVKYSEFSREDTNPREISIEDPEALLILQVLPIMYYDDGAHTKHPLGNQNPGADETSWLFFFIEDPSNYPWFAIYGLFAAYEADHNKYGGWFQGSPSKTTSGYVNMGHIAFNGATFTGGTVTSTREMLLLFPHMWVLETEIGVQIEGDTIADVNCIPETNPWLNTRKGLFKGDRTITKDDMYEWLKEYFIDITF